MISIKMTALFVLTLVLGVSRASLAQCNDLIDGCSPQAHEAPSDGHVIGAPSHDTCNLCAEGNAYNCHFSCFGVALSPETRAKYATLLDAASQRNVARVIALGESLGQVVRYNASRRAVQLLSCSGDVVVATLPVADPGMILAASRLRPAVVIPLYAFRFPEAPGVSPPVATASTGQVLASRDAR
jgi:hypothetical protein